MSGIWAKYNALLEAQPLLTKALTSLTGFTIGDMYVFNFGLRPSLRADNPTDEFLLHHFFSRFVLLSFL